MYFTRERTMVRNPLSRSIVYGRKVILPKDTKLTDKDRRSKLEL